MLLLCVWFVVSKAVGVVCTVAPVVVAETGFPVDMLQLVFTGDVSTEPVGVVVDVDIPADVVSIVPA